LADPPEIGISKISEDVTKKKQSAAFPAIGNWQLPSDAKAANKVCKVFSLGHGSLGCGPGSRKHAHYLKAGSIFPILVA
jgi:hypothetical protein